MKYTDLQRVKKILGYAEQLVCYLKETGLDKKTLIDDYKAQWAVTTPLYNIGEHVYYLSDAYKNAHNEIDWHQISGLRHRLVHDYNDTNWNIIADIIFEDIPLLIGQLKKLTNTGKDVQNDEEKGSSGDSV